MTSQELSAILGAVLSLLMSYIPGFATWYQPLSAEWKRFTMLIGLIVVVGATYGISCSGFIVSVTCDIIGVKELVLSFAAALLLNQGTFLMSPKVGLAKKSVKG
jgi:hypothetical protein